MQRQFSAAHNVLCSLVALRDHDLGSAEKGWYLGGDGSERLEIVCFGLGAIGESVLHKSAAKVVDLQRGEEERGREKRRGEEEEEEEEEEHKVKLRKNTQASPAQLALDANNWHGSQRRPQTTKAGPATQQRPHPERQGPN